MKPELLIWIIPVLFPFAFAAFWCFTMKLLAVTGGWQSMARSYAATSPPEGKKFGGQSAKVGFANYKGCLTIYLSPAGIHLAVWKLFSFAHPPLFIPWSAIHNATPHKILWVSLISFEVGSPKLARVMLKKEIFQAAAEFAPALVLAPN